MSRTTDFLKDVATSVLQSVLRRSPAPRSRRPAKPRRPTSTSQRESTTASRPAPKPAPAPTPADADAPGRTGPGATVEVSPARVGDVRLTYSPRTDGDPDPGEIIWTWVPYQENDGRGKDRPVLVVARETGGTVLAVQLTSKSHDGDVQFIPLGTGRWDAEGRPSWVNLERVFRVAKSGMRREALGLDAERFATVASALRARYHWGS